jgi:hypothetical protein
MPALQLKSPRWQEANPIDNLGNWCSIKTNNFKLSQILLILRENCGKFQQQKYGDLVVAATTLYSEKVQNVIHRRCGRL